MRTNRPQKSCLSCGRSFTWRKSFAKNWEDVKYCSNTCRKRKLSKIDQQIENTILELLEAQTHPTPLRTDQVADFLDFRNDKNLLETIKRAARRLESKNFVIITQDGKRVDSSKAKGHLQIRKQDGNWRVDRSTKTFGRLSERNWSESSSPRSTRQWKWIDLERNSHNTVRYANKAKTAS